MQLWVFVTLFLITEEHTHTEAFLNMCIENASSKKKKQKENASSKAATFSIIFKTLSSC